MNRKAQGALEFLTTYGWAFLVILIMIGAMMYFGILNPDKFLPERCTTNTGFSCEEHQISVDNSNLYVKFIIKNVLPDTIKLENSMNLKSEIFTGGNITLACTVDDSTIYQNQDTGVSCDVPKSNLVGSVFPQVGSKVKIVVDTKYKPVGKTLNKTLSTEIFGMVQNS